jgi:hypothetical protein
MFPTINLGALERYRVPVEWKGELSDIDPRERESIPFSRSETEAATALCEPSVPRRRTLVFSSRLEGHGSDPESIGRELESTRCVRASCSTRAARDQIRPAGSGIETAELARGLRGEPNCAVGGGIDIVGTSAREDAKGQHRILP